MKQDLYTIQEVSTLLGVSPKTLRRWEQTGKIKPIRTAGNQRRYRLEDVKKLERRINLQKAKREVRKEIAIAKATASMQEFQSQVPVVQQVIPQTPAQMPSPVVATIPPQTVERAQKELIKNKPNFRRYFKPFISGAAVVIVLLLAATLWQVAGYPELHPAVRASHALGATGESKSVLAATTAKPAFQLNVNIPGFFGKKVTFLNTVEIKKSLTVSGLSQLNGGIKTNNADINAGKGKITASNIIYSIHPGSNITISGDKQNPTISAVGGVTSLQGTTGAIVLAKGAGIGLNGLEISNTGVLSVQGVTGDVTLTGGSGISVSGTTISNTDGGSAQNIFKTITAGGTDITASSNTDQITFAAGSGITVTGDPGSKTVTIASNSTGSFSGMSVNGVVYATGASSGTSTLAGTTGTVLHGVTAGAPVFSAVDLTADVTGILPAANGGTGVNGATASNGQVLIGNGSGYQLSTLTQGSGIGITNGAGSISIANNGVLSLTGTANQVNVSGATGSITVSLPQSIATTSTPTFASLTLSAASNQLVLGSGNTATITAAGLGSGRTYTLPDGSGTFCLVELSNCAGGGGSIGGSGTTNYIAKFSSATGVTSSSIFDNGKVGIGTASPQGLFSVSGGVAGLALVNLNTTNEQNILVGSASGTTRFVFDASGDLNIIGGSYQIGGISMLSSTTLGSSVVNSSLTSVGALSSGSIASGFGTIQTNNTIQGTDITATGTTGLTASGNGAGLTFSGLNNHIISASSGTLELGATTLTGAIAGGGQNITGLGSINGLVITANTGTITTGTWNGTAIGAQYGGTGINTSGSTGVPFISGGSWSIDANALAATHGGTGQTAYAVGDILYADTTTSLAKRSVGSNGQILTVSGGVPVWSNAGGTINFWQENNGALAPLNITDDLLLGATSTTSAKFAFTNVAGGTPVASVSAVGVGTGLAIGGNGTLQSLQNGTLTIGGNTTGDIQFKPGNNASSLYLASNGNVGIGTLPTANTLTITGSAGMPGESAVLSLNETAASTYAVTFNNSAVANSQFGLWDDDHGNLDLWNHSNTTELMQINQNGNFYIPSGLVGINAGNYSGGTPQATLDVRTQSGILPIASFSGATTNAGVIIDQSGSGDLFTASKSGAKKFVINNNGNLQFTGSTNFLNTVTSLATANQTITIPALSGTDTLCFVTLGNCAGSGSGVTASGSNANYLPKFSGSQSITNSLLYDTGSAIGIGTITPDGYLTVKGGNAGGNAALVVNQIGATANDIIAASSAGTTKFELTNNGSLKFAGGSSFLQTLTSNAAAAKTFNLPDFTGASADICLNTGNCAGSGGGVTQSGTNANGQIAYFTSSNNLTSSANFLWNNDLEVSGANGSKAAGIFNQLNSGDIFTASASGTTKFTIANDGTLTDTKYTTNGGLLYVNGTAGVFAQTTAGSAGQVLQSNGGGAPTWVDAATLGTNYWQRNLGALSPLNITDDLLLGATSTTSARFAFINNIGSGTPTASISANSGNNATFLTGTGILGTTNDQNLQIGTATTGKIILGTATTASTANDQQDICLFSNSTCTAAQSGNGANSLIIYGGSSQTRSLQLTQNVGSNATITAASSNLVLKATGSTSQNVVLLPSVSTGFVGINTPTNTALFGTLDVRANVATVPVASFSGATTNAAAVVDQSGSGDIFSASVSGASKFTILNNGNVQINNLGTGVVQSGSTGLLSSSAINLSNTSFVTNTLGVANGGTGQSSFTDGQLLIGNSTGNTLTPATLTAGSGISISNGHGSITISQSGTGASKWTQDSANGVLYPNISTLDVLFGGTATSSARFAFLNNASGTPTASVSGSTGAASLTADGKLQTTNNQTLTLGGASTGNITLSPNGGSGTVTSTGTFNLSSGKTYQINGTDVLSGTMLGSSVVNSSLTSVGALVSGSIASGFGTISTSNTITGTTINGTTGINTGASGGTQRIDSSGNLVNIGNITSSGTVQFSHFGQGIAHFDSSGNISSTTVNLASSNDVSGTLVAGNGGTGFNTYTQGDLLYGNSSNTLSRLGIGASGQVLTVSGGLPVWSSVGGSINLWQEANGAIAPFNITDDLLLGATGTTSAKFAFSNVAGGTPTASISANSGNNATYLTGNGILSTTNDQTLQLGSSTTGNVLIPQLSGSGSTNAFQINNGGGAMFTVDTVNTRVTIGTVGNCISTYGSGRACVQNGAAGSGNNLNMNSTTLVTGTGGTDTGNAIFLKDTSASTGNTLQGLVIDATATTNANSTMASIIAKIPSGLGGNFMQFLNGSTTELQLTNAGSLSLGTATPLATLDVRGNVATTPIASLSGATTFANTVIDQSGSGDIFTASKSGATKFTILNNGNLQLNNYTTNNGLLYTNSTGLMQQLAPGLGSQCLLGNLTWSTCSAGANLWQENLGAVAPANITDDLLLGATSTNSARFAFINNTGAATTPVASISANSGNNATFLSGNGTLGTTNGQTLKLGAAGTGNIVLAPGGTTALTAAGANLTGAGTFTSTGLLTASNGLTVSSGTITFTGFNGVLQASSGTVTASALDLSGSNVTGILPVANGGSPFNQGSGAIFERLATQDLLLGSNATTSATFAFINVAGGTPTASVAAATGATSLTATGILGTTNRQSLTLGNATSGNINLAPGGFTVLTATASAGSSSVILPAIANGSQTAFQVLTNGSQALTVDTAGNHIIVGASANCQGSNTGRLCVNQGFTGSATGVNLNNSLTFTGNGSGGNVVAHQLYLTDTTTGSGLTMNGMVIDQTGSTNTGSTVNSIISKINSAQINLGNFIQFQTGGSTVFNVNNAGYLGVGTGSTGNGALAVNQANTGGDIFAASQSGSTKFKIANNGAVSVLGGLTSDIDTLTGTTLNIGATNATTITLGRSGQSIALANYNNCGALTTTGTTLVCSGTPTGTNFWQLNTNALSPNISTYDFLLGGTSSSSAKFAVLNMAGGTPTASVAGSFIVMPYMNGSNQVGGNLGINTTSPQYPLDVNLGDHAGTSNAWARIYGQESDAGLDLQNTYTGGVGWFLDSAGSGSFVGQGNFAISQVGVGGVPALTVVGPSNMAGGGYGIRINAPTFSSNNAATLDVNNGNGILATASISGATSFAGLLVDNSGNGDLFTASKSGATKFTILNNGNISLANYNNCGALTTTGTTLTCSTTPSGTNFWDQLSGVLTPKIETQDLLLGGTATTSAKFAFINVNSNTPTASISANSGNNATYLTGTGVLGTTNRQTLQLGDTATGNIVIDSPNVLNLNTTNNKPVNTGSGLTTLGGNLQINGNNIQDSGATTRIALGATTTLTNTTTTFTGTTTFTASSLATFSTAATLGVSATTLNLGNGSAAVLGTTSNSNLTFTPNGSGQTLLSSDFDSGVAIGSANSTPAPLVINGGIGNNGALIVNQKNSIGDIFDASQSGTTKFTIGNNGAVSVVGGLTSDLDTLTATTLKIGATNATTLSLGRSGQTINLPGYGSANNSILYADTTANGVLSKLTTSSANQCLLSGATTPSWGSCDLGTTSWAQSNGAIYPGNSTEDLLVGGTATTSAKFAFINVAGGSPTASISGNLSLAVPTGANPATTLNLLNGGTFAVKTSPGGDAGLGANPALYIANNGQVGLGTNAVSQNVQLTVKGNTDVVADFRSNSSNVAARLTPASGAFWDFTAFTSNKLSIQASDVDLVTLTSAGNLGIGATSPEAPLTVSGAYGGNAAVIVNQLNSGDIFVASQSGTTKFKITNAGALNLVGGQTSDLDTLTGTTLNIGATNATTISLGRSGQSITLPGYNNCGALTTSGTTLTCSATPTGTNFWDSLNGVITPKIETQDLLLGAQATTSAKFAFINVNSNTPTASISANSGNNATFLAGNGTLGTTNSQTLTIGGATTGNIVITPLNGASGSNFISNAVNNTYAAANAALSFTGGGTNVFSSTGTLQINAFQLGGTENANNNSISSVNTLSFGSNNLSLTGTTISTAGSNNDLTLTPNGSGQIILSSDLDTGVTIGSKNTTPAPLVINGGIGNNGALILNQKNSGDIFDASQSGTTKFQITNGGSVNLVGGQTSDLDTLTNTTLKIGASTATTLSLGRSGQTINLLGYASGNNSVLFADNSVNGVLSKINTSSVNQCLLSGASTPTWGSCDLGTTSWVQNNGAIYQGQGTADLLLGGTNPSASSSAGFHIFGTLKSGTNPTASASANSSFAGFVIDQAGSGDLFTASKSGATKFVINNAGNVGIGTANPGVALDLSLGSTSGNGIRMTGSASDLDLQLINTSTGGKDWVFDTAGTGGLLNSGSLTLQEFGQNPLLEMQSVTTAGGTGGGQIGINVPVPLNGGHVNATLDIRGNKATQPVASLSGGSNFANLVVDQSGSGDIFTASVSGLTKFTVKNSGTVVIGNNTNGIIFDPTGATTGIYAGTARPTKQIVLSPEFAGAVLTASNSATTNGFMTSDASPSASSSTYNFENYYQWTSTQTSSLQDYTVAVRVTLPKDFSAWTTNNAVQIDYNTNLKDKNSNKFDTYIYVPSVSSSTPQVYDQAIFSATDKTWATESYTGAQVTNWSQTNPTAVIYLKLYSKNGLYTQVGDIKLNYLSAF